MFRVGRIGAAIVLLFQLCSAATAQDLDPNLPPPPGALARELGGDSAIAIPRAVAGSAPVASVEIPFILEGGHIIIEASINGGASRPFLFDTGGRILITPDVARGMSSTPLRQDMVAGIGPHRFQASIVKVDRISVGGVTLEQPSVTIADIPNLIVDRGSKPRLAGLIGPELLMHRTVTLDYRRHVLVLRRPGQLRPGTNAIVCRLGFSVSPEGLGHPSIDAQIGGVSGQFVIDTGSSGTLFLESEFFRTHSPFQAGGKIVRYRSPGGIGGPLDVETGMGGGFQLGSATLGPLLVTGPAGPVRVARVNPLAHISGLIGSVVLSQFVVTLDLDSQQAWFEPIAGAARPAVWFSHGLILDKPEHDSFEVIDILPDTMAARSGIRRGERIVAVGGQPARNLGIRDLPRFHTKSDKPVTFETADQQRYTLGPSQIVP